jgi:hypothetical protein
VKLFLRKLYFCQIFQYNLERWYDKLQACATQTEEDSGQQTQAALTAPTKFLQLTESDLKMLGKLYTRSLLGQSNLEGLSRPEMVELTNLERRIAALMEGDKAWFVRLSTRSPKDGVQFSAEKTEPAINRLTKKYRALQVTSPQQVTALLSKSERVFGDITNFFQYRVPGTASENMFLILREWIENLPYDREFRCFIYKRKLTAISQYHCYHVFESMQDPTEVEKIRDAVVAFHSRVDSALPYQSYVMDVLVLPDYTVQVIEINPFGAEMSSGAALFNWEADRQVLYGLTPSNPPPIRVLRHLIED